MTRREATIVVVTPVAHHGYQLVAGSWQPAAGSTALAGARSLHAACWPLPADVN